MFFSGQFWPIGCRVKSSIVIEMVFAVCSQSRVSGSAMKLGKKGKDVESFVDKLMAEGESGLLFVCCCDDALPILYLICFRFPLMMIPYLFCIFLAGVTSAADTRQPAAVTKTPSQALQER